MIRDQRRLVPVVPGEEDAALPSRWDADLPRNERAWWQEGWQATAAPVKEMTAKLIPIVTTAQTIDAVELAQTYIHRWPAQENVIKDYLLPLGLDTNHGFAKMAVENSEVAKRRIHLEQRLYQATLELQGMADYVLRRQIKERQAAVEAELEPIRAKEWRAYEQCNSEVRKQERYCKEQ